MDKNLNLKNLKFDYLDSVACYTGNNSTNKSMDAIKKVKIINALFQLEENIHEILRQLNAYDASSILVAESNWMKRNHFSKYMPKQSAPNKKVELGQVCTVDYGKAYKGEIGYIHPGLCVAKKENKYLIIPMTTGKKWRNNCYHPLHNPNMTKQNRQTCIAEGFSKDGVLLMNDAKFVSGGRIMELHEIIPNKTLKEIQEQLFGIILPDFLKKRESLEKDNLQLNDEVEKLKRRITNLEGQAKNLKIKNEKLIKKIDKYKNSSMNTSE